MAIPGRKPIEDRSLARNKMPPVHDWTEVENIPYTGPKPDLPARFWSSPDQGQIQVRWPEATVRWWEVVSSMPHCKLWTQADWEDALTTAELHARFAEGGSSAQLRMREKALGLTMDSRRDMRIRYVEPKTKAEQPAGQQGEVVNLADYRDLYGEGAG